MEPPTSKEDITPINQATHKTDTSMLHSLINGISLHIRRWVDPNTQDSISIHLSPTSSPHSSSQANLLSRAISLLSLLSPATIYLSRDNLDTTHLSRDSLDTIHLSRDSQATCPHNPHNQATTHRNQDNQTSGDRQVVRTATRLLTRK